MKKLKLSICITNWNAQASLVRTLDVLRSRFEGLRELPYDIFVFDQGSTDGSAEWLRNFGPNIDNLTVIFNPRNAGQSISRNTMRRRSEGEYILFLDADVLPIPGSISAMLRYLDTHKHIGAVCYDIKSDTHVQTDATPAENVIQDEDIEHQKFMFFHYSMLRREFAERHPLPEFAPFDGPGWGLEEDCAQLCQPEDTTAVVKYRKFFHDPSGRSKNSLGSAWQKSRVKRCVMLTYLKTLDLFDLDCYFVHLHGETPNMGPVPIHHELVGPSLTHDAAMYALSEYFPFENKKSAGSSKWPIAFEHEIPHLKRNTVKDPMKESCLLALNSCLSALNVIPTHYSPIWLLANEPAITIDDSMGEPVWRVGLDEHKDPSMNYKEFIKQLKYFSAVSTSDIHLFLLSALHGVPVRLAYTGDITEESHRLKIQQLEDFGLLPNMDLAHVLAFRSLVQQTCCNNVVLPLVQMLLRK